MPLLRTSTRLATGVHLPNLSACSNRSRTAYQITRSALRHLQLLFGKAKQFPIDLLVVNTHRHPRVPNFARRLRQPRLDVRHSQRAELGIVDHGERLARVQAFRCGSSARSLKSATGSTATSALRSCSMHCACVRSRTQAPTIWSSVPTFVSRSRLDLKRGSDLPSLTPPLPGWPHGDEIGPAHLPKQTLRQRLRRAANS